MGLIRGMARTAAVAGTATVVSNRVSRRQANRWADKEQQQAAAEPQQPAPQAQQPQPVYAPAPVPAPAAAASADAASDMLDQLTKLGELKAAGVLTEEEFESQKARILGAG